MHHRLNIGMRFINILCVQGRDMQISMEQAFLSKSKCISFRISDQDYRLFFSSTTEMYQENVRYGTRKEVRRRPAEFQSRAHIQLKRYVQNTDI